MRGSYAVLAFGLLAVTLHMTPGLLSTDGAGRITPATWLALATLIAVLALSLIGACVRPAPVPPAVLNVTLVTVIALQFLLLIWHAPSIYREYRENDPLVAAFRGGVLVLVVLAASYALPGGRWTWLRPPLFLGVYALLGASLILGASK